MKPLFQFTSSLCVSAVSMGAIYHINTTDVAHVSEFFAGRSSLVVIYLTAMWEVLGSNLTAGSCVYRDSCSIWLVRDVLHIFIAVPRSTQPSTLSGTVKWVPAFALSNNKWWWWMRMVATVAYSLNCIVSKVAYNQSML